MFKFVIEAYRAFKIKSLYKKLDKLMRKTYRLAVKIQTSGVLGEARRAMLLKHSKMRKHSVEMKNKAADLEFA